jgi:hypothetical protein
VNFAARLTMALLQADSVDLQQSSGKAWYQSNNGPALDKYVGVVVLAMFVTGVGILVARLVKWHRNRYRIPFRRADIRQFRRRYGGV